jgi:hypothetical protein
VELDPIRLAAGARHLSLRRLALRHAAGLDRPTRVRVQIERDERIARLRQLDEELDRLAADRRELVDRLEDDRDRLYPPVPFVAGRRPPAHDQPPLPPQVTDPVLLGGRRLRSVALGLLRRHGPLALRDLHALLHWYGFAIDSPTPVRALADALGYEHEQGRAVRVRRGVYRAAGPLPRRGRHGRPDLGPHPSPDPQERIATDEPAAPVPPGLDAAGPPAEPDSAGERLDRWA